MTIERGTRVKLLRAKGCITGTVVGVSKDGLYCSVTTTRTLEELERAEGLDRLPDYAPAICDVAEIL